MSRRILTRSLSEAGYHCQESAGGVGGAGIAAPRNAVAAAPRFHMPEFDGAEVLRSLRADKDPTIAQLPAIMLTGHGGEESEVLCLEAGANDFVTKPINIPVLRAQN